MVVLHRDVLLLDDESPFLEALVELRLDVHVVVAVDHSQFLYVRLAFLLLVQVLVPMIYIKLNIRVDRNEQLFVMECNK